jgi:hypothetical protein
MEVLTNTMQPESRTIIIQRLHIDLTLPISFRILDGAFDDLYRCYTPLGIYTLPMRDHTATRILSQLLPDITYQQRNLLKHILTSDAWTLAS